MTETISKDQYKAMTETKPSKYRSKRVKYDGKTFDSIKEYKRWLVLEQMERDGEISHLEYQPVFYFIIKGEALKSESGRKLSYRADAAYFDYRQNKRICEDTKTKATKTPLYKLKRALVEAIYPAVKIVEI